MAAGERLQPDVAECLDEQRGGRLRVHRGIAEVDRAAEAQFVTDDGVARVRDRMTDDGDFLSLESTVPGTERLTLLSSAPRPPGLRLRFTIS